MNSDIRLSCGFWSHPKTKRLVKRLGLEGVRSLQILWLWAAQERPSGCLSGMDAEDIELAADWNGEDGKFFTECLGRWIDEGEDGFCLHDWEDHNAWASEADNRSDTARLSRLARVNKEAAAGLRADGRTGVTKDEYRMYAEGTPYERRTTKRTTPAPAPTLRTKEIKKPPYPPQGGEVAGPSLPIPPEENPDNLPGAEISDLSECLIEFQDIAAVFQDAGGNVDTVTAYSTFLPMRFNFPKDRVVDDIATRGQSDAWRRMDVPMNLSTYLSKKKWLDPIPKPRERARASPQPRTFRDKRQMESEQTAKRLKAAMGISNASVDAATGQVSHGFVQHAALGSGAEKPG